MDTRGHREEEPTPEDAENPEKKGTAGFSALRAMLIVMVVLNLALVVVFLEARGTKLRYALARKREAVRAETLENRKWMLAVAKARRPEALARQAARFGLTIKDEERGETGEVARDRRRP